ncbi:DUF2953 domain-containing protein [Paenibacillus aurantius]|uniref:DUF2953 domain-containing protein n=1 Tax=Paenibacillus aurantius TaxID=2918900 RepID=A0AA96LC24_9BACL|nr:DUF2953 domain-containing protein [Paenibacillus aurantius]WNQ09331.1 DUF2953 domain-containing protein [Paenibacillus aurantius]
MFWIGLLLFIVLAVAVILWSDIHILARFSRVKDNDKLTLEIRMLFGWIRYKVKIPTMNFEGFRKGLNLKVKGKSPNVQAGQFEDTQQITKESLEQWYRTARRVLNEIFSFSDWFRDTLAKVRCTDLRWITRIGVGDAPETAILTGIGWGIKSSLLGYVFKFIRLDTKPKIHIQPHYNEVMFSTEAEGRAQIRVFYAMLAGIYLVIRVVKVNGGRKTWRLIRTRKFFDPGVQQP